MATTTNTSTTTPIGASASGVLGSSNGTASTNASANISNQPSIPVNPTTPPIATPVTPPSSTIDASSLGSTQPLTSSNTQTTQNGSQVDSSGNVVTQGASDFANSLSTQYTPPPDNPTLAGAEQNQNDLTDKLAQLQGQEDQKGAATQAAYQSGGVYTAQQNMTALYNNLQTQTAQFNQQEENALEGPGSGQSQNIALGAEGLVQRQAAVQLGVDTAVYNAANNNYTTAKAIADQTIAFQFQPIEQQIADTQNFLTINATNLSVGEQKQAQIVQGSLALQQAQIDQAKTDRSASLSIMTSAAQSGLTDPATLKAIANASPGDAAALAGPYLSFQYLQNLYLSGYLKTAPTPPGAAPTDSTSISQTPAVVNNNPGNLKDPTTGQFMKFPSTQAGFVALQQDLYAKGTGATSTSLGPNSTLSQFASVYAPSSDGNDPESYATNIATTLGVPTTTTLKSLVSDPVMLKKFANAVSLQEDSTENQFVNGTPPVASTASIASQTNLQTANNLISSAPLPFQSDLKTIASTGDVFSTAQAGSPSAIWASRNNIPVITTAEASTVKGVDAALASLQAVQDNFTSLAPTSRFGALTSNFINGFKNSATQGGGAINEYNDTTLATAAAALSDITGVSGSKLFNAASVTSALPKIAIGNLLTGGNGNSDTLQQGLDKLNSLRATLNATLKSILPNSPGIQPAQVPAQTVNTTTYSYNGQNYTQGPDGLYYPSTQ